MLRALLWDADGVLQHTPVGWVEALDGASGPGFAQAVFEAERAAMCGLEPLRVTLQRVLDGWPDPRTDVAALLRLWERARVDADAMALVDEVRRAGVTCALATNQQDHRRAWMRDHLRHDERFDRVYYSCELGVAKPDAAFFERILDDLGLDAGEVGFVDDSPANVDAATRVGLRAVWHDPASGVEALRAEVGHLCRGGLAEAGREPKGAKPLRRRGRPGKDEADPS